MSQRPDRPADQEDTVVQASRFDVIDASGDVLASFGVLRGRDGIPQIGMTVLSPDGGSRLLLALTATGPTLELVAQGNQRIESPSAYSMTRSTPLVGTPTSA